VRYYQRLLARDQSEAAEIIQRHVATQPIETVYDAILLPALNYAERDRLEGRLTEEEEQVVLEESSELLHDTAGLQRALKNPSACEDPTAATAPARVEVLAYPANGPGDAIALEMLAQLLETESIHLDVPSVRLLSSEIVDRARERGSRLVCIADLPPSAPSKTRYAVRKLRSELPDVTILVGRWAPAPLADENRRLLEETGAHYLAATILETRNQLRQLAAQERQRLDSKTTSPAVA
jgi:hypothetical protein